MCYIYIILYINDNTRRDMPAVISYIYLKLIQFAWFRIAHIFCGLSVWGDQLRMQAYLIYTYP